MENYVNLGACCRIISNTSMDLSIEVIVLEIRIWHGARSFSVILCPIIWLQQLVTDCEAYFKEIKLL